MATTLSSVVLVIVLLIVLAIVGVAAFLLRRRASQAPAQPVAAPVAPVEPDSNPPMTGLESALAQVTDRDGRPIGERIEEESQHVDDLRVPDDTGPLLRRALDHVEHHDDKATGNAGADDAPGDASAEPA